MDHEEEATFENSRATRQKEKEPGFLMTVEPPKLPWRLYVKEKEISLLFKSLLFWSFCGNEI